MQIELIGEYEATLTPGDARALVIHHLVRGHDVVAMDDAEAAELRELLATRQKRIRELAGYNVILGGGGDLTFYAANGARACYLSADQAARLVRLLGGS